jgi:hypothetical protein
MSVLFMSGYTDDEFADGKLGPGDAFLQKPVDTVALILKVRASLRLKSLHDQLLKSREEAQALADALGAERLIVGVDAREFRGTQANVGPWKTGHCLVVGVGPSPFSEPLIRWARRMGTGRVLLLITEGSYAASFSSAHGGRGVHVVCGRVSPQPDLVGSTQRTDSATGRGCRGGDRGAGHAVGPGVARCA